jgi:chromosome segregation protein
MAVLLLRPHPGWYTYSDAKSPVGQPTRLRVELEGHGPLQVALPPGRMKRDSVDRSIQVEVYAGVTPLFVPLPASAQPPFRLKAGLRQQQLWFLKRAESQAEGARIQAEGAQLATQLEARIAELRHVEVELENVRQAHYAAGDQVNQAQGRLYEASAEVGRLEAEIRYVVEGRQRAVDRLAQLRAQIAQWDERQRDAQAESERLAEQAVQAEDTALTLAAQFEEQAQALPELEDAWRSAREAAQGQRNHVTQVQQQIQLLAVEQRNLDEQSRSLQQRRERLSGEHHGLQAPDGARLAQLQAEERAAQDEAQAANERLHALQTQAPALDEARRAAQHALNEETAKQAQLAARLDALRALQEKLRTDGKLKHIPGMWDFPHVDARHGTGSLSVQGPA